MCHFHSIRSLYIFLGANSYTFYFITWAKCLNNEHKDNQEIQPKFDFERMPCTDDIGFEEYMDDEALPFEMRRLNDQESKQYCPIKKKSK